MQKKLHQLLHRHYHFLGKFHQLQQQWDMECLIEESLFLFLYIHLRHRDMIRRRQYEKANKKDTDALMAELEELRRMKAEKEQQ